MSIIIYAEMVSSEEGTPVMRAVHTRLEENHGGGPYATHHLFREAFQNFEGATIPVATLRERLPETLRLVERRCRFTFGISHDGKIAFQHQQYKDFVEECEFVEDWTGEQLTFVVSQ